MELKRWPIEGRVENAIKPDEANDQAKDRVVGSWSGKLKRNTRRPDRLDSEYLQRTKQSPANITEAIQMGID